MVVCNAAKLLHLDHDHNRALTLCRRTSGEPWKFFVSFRNWWAVLYSRLPGTSPETLREVASRLIPSLVPPAPGGLSDWGRVSHSDAACSVWHRLPEVAVPLRSDGAFSFTGALQHVRTLPQSHPCRRCFFGSFDLGIGSALSSVPTGCRSFSPCHGAAPTAPLQQSLQVLGTDKCLCQVSFATSLAARMQSQRGVWK